MYIQDRPSSKLRGINNNTTAIVMDIIANIIVVQIITIIHHPT